VRQEINFHQRMTMAPKSTADMQTYLDVFAKVIDNIGELRAMAKGYKKEYMVSLNGIGT